MSAFAYPYLSGTSDPDHYQIAFEMLEIVAGTSGWRNGNTGADSMCFITFKGES